MRRRRWNRGSPGTRTLHGGSHPGAGLLLLDHAVEDGGDRREVDGDAGEGVQDANGGGVLVDQDDETIRKADDAVALELRQADAQAPAGGGVEEATSHASAGCAFREKSTKKRGIHIGGLLFLARASAMRAISNIPFPRRRPIGVGHFSDRRSVTTARQAKPRKNNYNQSDSTKIKATV